MNKLTLTKKASRKNTLKQKTINSSKLKPSNEDQISQHFSEIKKQIQNFKTYH